MYYAILSILSIDVGYAILISVAGCIPQKILLRLGCGLSPLDPYTGDLIIKMTVLKVEESLRC